MSPVHGCKVSELRRKWDFEMDKRKTVILKLLRLRLLTLSIFGMLFYGGISSYFFMLEQFTLDFSYESYITIRWVSIMNHTFYTSMLVVMYVFSLIQLIEFTLVYWLLSLVGKRVASKWVDRKP